MSLDGRTPFLSGENVGLYAVEEDDLPRLRDLVNTAEVRVPTDFGRPKNLQDEQEWFEAVSEDDAQVQFAIVHDERVIGMFGIEFTDPDSRTARIGYFLDPDVHSQGLGTEAAELAIDYAFDELNARKLWARVFTFNEKSIGLLEKLGFTEEGRLRDHTYKNGEYQDAFIYGLLRDEWWD